MTIYKLRAPNNSTSIIGDRHTRPALWLILGVAYTDSETVAQYASRNLYAVTEVDEIPNDYVEQSRRLDAFPGIPVNALTDGADADQAFRFDGPGHTQIDIRDVISGRVTA